MRLGPARPQAIDQFTCLKDIDRSAIGPVGQELAAVRDSLGLVRNRAGSFERGPVPMVDLELEHQHGRTLAQLGRVVFPLRSSCLVMRTSTSGARLGE